MTARKDRQGKFHSTLADPALSAEQADDLKAKLFGAHKPPSDDVKKAIAKVHRPSES